MTLTTPAPAGTSVTPSPRRASAAPARVTAVVVAHDVARWLPRTLAALAAQTRPVDLVVAADTGSDDDSAELLRAALGEARVLELPRRTGYGAAVRAAL